MPMAGTRIRRLSAGDLCIDSIADCQLSTLQCLDVRLFLTQIGVVDVKGSR